MHPLRTFLLYFESQGKKNRHAIKLLAQALQDTGQGQPGKAHFLSQSTISRIRNGKHVPSADTPEIRKLIERVLAAESISNAGESLHETLERIQEDETFKSYIRELEVSLNLEARLAVGEFDEKTIHLLEGTWFLYSYGSVGIPNSDPSSVKLRIGLRHFQFRDGKLNSCDIGITTKWRGEANRTGSYILLVAHENTDTELGEKAFFIYKVPLAPERYYKSDDLMITGQVLTVVFDRENDKDHIFSSRCK